MIEESSSIQSTHRIHFEKCDPVTVRADREKIASVISNILNNAVKYSPADSNVKITCIKKDGYARIDIHDEGHGIQKADQERLFDRYYRVKSNRHIAGFGIGLYLSAEIVQQHEGTIGVNSEPGKGSTFYFTLPVK